MHTAHGPQDDTDMSCVVPAFSCGIKVDMSRCYQTTKPVGLVEVEWILKCLVAHLSPTSVKTTEAIAT